MFGLFLIWKNGFNKKNYDNTKWLVLFVQRIEYKEI